LIVRRWSDTVLALYAEDGNPFGGYLVEVVTQQAFCEQSERVSGYDNEGGRAGAQTPVDPGLAPTRPERFPMMTPSPDRRR
jgi:hypothetical protein